MSNYATIKDCRVCYSLLQEVVSFEPQYIASTFVNTNEGRNNIKVPLTLMLCTNLDCSLVQLKETVNPELLYKEYFYRSNISETMNRDLRDVVREACARVKLTPKDWILDIGANDGLMLTMYPKSAQKHGIDPAQNINRPLLKDREDIYFQRGYFPDEILTTQQYKVITATACFYDFPDPNRAVQEIKTLLHPDGVAIIQVSYLYDTIKDMNFYDICHEHLEYYSLKSLRYLFSRNGLQVLDASTNAVNGGSLRIIVQHEQPIQLDKTATLQHLEDTLQLDSPKTYKKFETSVKQSAKKVREYVLKSKGLVIGLGASTKGNVLLQLCDLGKQEIPYISERNPEKVGLRTMGGDIELISEEAARALQPAVMFVIPWNFKNEIVAREQDYIQSGGKLLFIMPYPYILDKNGEHRL